MRAFFSHIARRGTDENPRPGSTTGFGWLGARIYMRAFFICRYGSLHMSAGFGLAASAIFYADAFPAEAARAACHQLSAES